MASSAQAPEHGTGTEPVASLHATTLAKLNGNGQASVTSSSSNVHNNGGQEFPELRVPRPRYASGAPPNILVPRLNRPYDEPDNNTTYETTPQSSPLESRFSPSGSGRPSTSSSPTSTSRRDRFGQLANSPSGSPLARSDGFPLNDTRVIGRRSTTTDRHRPSTLAPSQPRRHTSLQYGRRPTLVTGGYESSTDEDDPAQILGTSARSPDRRLTITPTRTLTSTSTASSAHATHGHGTFIPSPQQNSRALNGTSSLPHQHLSSASGRRRAQSLVTPAMADQSAPPTPRRQSRLRASAGVGLGSPMSSRGTGTGSSPRMDGSPFVPRIDGPSLMTARSGSLRGPRDAVREEPERERSPSTSHTEKRRSKRESQQGNPLTASLGLGPAPREAILSADQLQDLLGNSDVASALQLLSPRHPAAASRHLPPSVPTAHEPLQSALEPEHEPHPQDTSVTSPPKPFLVSAPPALTNGEWPGRPRAASTASSFAGPSSYGSLGPSRLAGPRHRTVSASTSVDSDTLPLPPGIQMQGDDDIDERREEEEEQNNAAYEAPTDGAAQPQQQQQQQHTHRQPSQRRLALPTPVNADEGVVETPSTVKPPHIKERHRISSFFGLRKKDKVHSSPPTSVQTQSSPLPEPQREPPQRLETAFVAPRLDPEEEMRRAEQQRREDELAQERRYKALMQIHSHPAALQRGQRTATHLDAYYSLIYDGINNPPKMNPLAVLRWKKRTIEQKEARAKWEADNAKPPSFGASTSPSKPGHISRNSFSSSFNRTLSPRPSGSAPEEEGRMAKGWYYSLNDVVAYNACGGRVDFFIPPAPAIEEDEHDERDDAGKARGFSTSLKSGQSAESKSQRPSFGSEDRGRDLPYVSALMSEPLPPSSSSLILAPENVMYQGDLTQPPTPDRSRQGSVDHGSYPRHRHTHSTAGAPQPSTLQQLRALPKHLGNSALEKISSALDTDEFGARRFPSESPAQSSKGHGRSHSLAHHETRGTRERIRSKIGNLRSNDHNNATGTSEDEQHHHFRKLLSKTQRWAQRPTSTVDPDDPIIQEQQQLLETIKREREIRGARRPTLVEEQAQERWLDLSEIRYPGKVKQLRRAQEHLGQLDDDQEQMNITLAHHLKELERVQKAFAVTTDLDIEFDNLPPPPAIHIAGEDEEDDEDETADELYPLRSDSETGYRPFRPKRQGALPPSNLPGFGTGSKPWPMRSVTDPSLNMPVNPIRRLELFCEKAQDTRASMTSMRQEATESLQDMVNSVNMLIRQKDIIRNWVRLQLDQIQRLKEERQNVQLKIKGGIKPRLWTWRFQDVAIDTSARAVMSFLSYLIRTYRLGRRVVGSGWLGWTAIAVVIGAVCFFYYVGDTQA